MENDSQSKSSQSEFIEASSNLTGQTNDFVVVFSLDVVHAKGYDHDVPRRGGGHRDTSVCWLYGLHRNDGANTAVAIAVVHSVRYDCQPSDYGKNGFFLCIKGKNSGKKFTRDDRLLDFVRIFMQIHIFENT